MRRDHPLIGRPSNRLPRDHRPPLIHRLLDHDAADDAGRAALGRDLRLAMVEAALMAADEPLTARRLAAVAGLADAAECVGWRRGCGRCTTRTARRFRWRNWRADGSC